MDPALQWALGILVTLGVSVVLAAFAAPRLTAGAKSRDIEQTLTTMKTALEVERDLRNKDNERFTQALREERELRHRQEVRHTSEVAELRGQLQAMTGELAKMIVRAVREEMQGGN